MQLKFIVRPGFVRSVYDGERHFITGSQLMNLYGVDWRECVVENTGIETRGLRGEFIILEPRHFSADYKLELCQKVNL